mgnify:FL=1
MKNVFYYGSPLGTIGIAENGTGITDLFYGKELPGGAEVRETGLLRRAAQQLSEYFAGKRRAFDLPLQAQGTPFQKRVWQALREIPYGQTRGYGEIAASLGNPKAGRAVGAANHRNPIAIVVPCHRVIGADGSLVGYASGLDIKRKLLALESGIIEDALRGGRAC